VVYVGLHGRFTAFSLAQRENGFILASRLRSIRHFRDNGISSKSARYHFGKEYLKAYNAGLEQFKAKSILRKEQLTVSYTKEETELTPLTTEERKARGYQTTHTEAEEIKGLDRIPPETFEKLEAGARRMLKMYGGAER
jgi:hypothetical protein